MTSRYERSKNRIPGDWKIERRTNKQTGERLMTSTAINYLGYERRTDDTTIAHLKKRTEQATKA